MAGSVGTMEHVNALNHILDQLVAPKTAIHLASLITLLNATQPRELALASLVSLDLNAKIRTVQASA